MANEKRLIDANELRTQFDDIPPYIGLAGSLVQQYIDNAPTVDAVEVVRCKDCKHYDKDALWCNINSPMFSEEHHNWYEDDFCSIGEKMMDGDGNA